MRNDNVAIYELELGISATEEDSKEINTCRFCKKMYSCTRSYNRHMKSGCKHKTVYMKKLEDEALCARRDAAGTVINNNTQHINTINIHLPPLRAFGDENIDYITTKELLKELKKIKDVKDISSIIANFTKLIHANPAHPENHNVQISSLNGSYGRIFNGLKFENEDVTSIQDQILNRIGDTIMSKVDTDEKVQEDITPRKLENIMIALDEDVKGDVGRENDRNTRKYRHKVKQVLYNSRNYITNTENLMLKD
jgi:hypothetical protein